MFREDLLNIVEGLELNQVVQLNFYDLKFNIGKQLLMQNEYIVYGFQNCDLKANIVSEWSDEDIVESIIEELEDVLFIDEKLNKNNHTLKIKEKESDLSNLEVKSELVV